VAVELPFLSICPRVRKSHGKLIAESALSTRIFTLGGYYRKVVVDPKKEEVSIHRRSFWFVRKRRRIRFGSIAGISYGYQDWSGGQYWSWAHKSSDIFSVGLRLHGGGDVHLFHFYGEGAFQNHGPLPDWMYWDDYLFDTSGTQEGESKAFVELLSKMTGAPVEPGRA
jgi:hypothetical protein